MSKDVIVNPVINYPVDKKSQQVLNKDIPVAIHGYSKLKDTDSFNDPTSELLVDQHLKKKGKATSIYFLVDRLRFTKKRNHQYISYREIERIIKFERHPSAFMLWVSEESKKPKRTYETYTCTDPKSLELIRAMILTAIADPKRLLNEVGPVRLVSLSSSSSSEYMIEKKSFKSRHNSTEYLEEEPLEYVYYEEKEPVYSRSVARPRSAAPRQQIMPTEEVVYLEEPERRVRSRPREQGPVYMYVSRSKENQGSSPEYTRRIYH